MADKLQILIEAILAKTTKQQLMQELKNIEKNLKPVEIDAKLKAETQNKLFKSLQKIYKEEEKNRLTQEKYAQKALVEKEKALQYEQKVRMAIEQAIAKEKQKTEEMQKQVALYKEELQVRLQNAQTSFGKHFTDEQKEAIISKADLITVENYRDAVKDTNLEYDKQVAKSRESRKEATLQMKESDTFMKTFIKDLGKLAIWGAAATIVYAPLRSLKEGIVYLKELDGSLNEIRIVTGYTQAEVQKLADSYNSLAKEMNVSTRELAGQAADLFRQGLDSSQVEERMKSIIQYAKVSSISLEESNRIITATANATGESVQKITDIFAFLGDTTAAGADEIGEALQRVASASENSNLSLEKSASWLATISSVTRESASTIGRSLNFEALAA